MTEILQKLRRVVSQVFCCKLFIVASRPFCDKGTWKILYGTYTSYRLLEFSTHDAASREFDAINDFADYRFGDGVYDFLVLTAEQTSRAAESYAEVVDEAIRARSAQHKIRSGDLMAVLD
jgi:hypothetical protein